MRRHGGLSEEWAWEAALEAYPYESSDTEPYRGLVFHDEAWHWAMLALYGGDYPGRYPEFEQPSAEYRALDC